MYNLIKSELLQAPLSLIAFQEVLRSVFFNPTYFQKSMTTSYHIDSTPFQRK